MSPRDVLGPDERIEVDDLELCERLQEDEQAEAFRTRHRARPDERYLLVRLRPEVALHPTIAQSFGERARKLAALRHPSLTPVALASDGLGIACLFEPERAAPTLSQWLDGRALPLPAVEAARLIAPLAGGLAQAHAEGLAHGQILPERIAIFGEGENVAPRLGGFVLASAGPLIHAPDEAMHTVAPERISGQPASPASDVYSLAALLFELVAGVAPPGEEAELAAYADVPAGLSRFIARCLHRSPHARPGARQFEQLLGQLAAGADIRTLSLFPPRATPAPLMRSVPPGAAVADDSFASLAAELADAPPTAKRSGSPAVVASDDSFADLAAEFADAPSAPKRSGSPAVVASDDSFADLAAEFADAPSAPKRAVAAPAVVASDDSFADLAAEFADAPPVPKRPVAAPAPVSEDPFSDFAAELADTFADRPTGTSAAPSARSAPAADEDKDEDEDEFIFDAPKVPKERPRRADQPGRQRVDVRLDAISSIPAGSAQRAGGVRLDAVSSVPPLSRAKARAARAAQPSGSNSPARSSGGPSRRAPGPVAGQPLGRIRPKPALIESAAASWQPSPRRERDDLTGEFSLEGSSEPVPAPFQVSSLPPALRSAAPDSDSDPPASSSNPATTLAGLGGLPGLHNLPPELRRALVAEPPSSEPPDSLELDLDAPLPPPPRSPTGAMFGSGPPRAPASSPRPPRPPPSRPSVPGKAPRSRAASGRIAPRSRAASGRIAPPPAPPPLDATSLPPSLPSVSAKPPAVNSARPEPAALRERGQLAASLPSGSWGAFAAPDARPSAGPRASLGPSLAPAGAGAPSLGPSAAPATPPRTSGPATRAALRLTTGFTSGAVGLLCAWCALFAWMAPIFYAHDLLPLDRLFGFGRLFALGFVSATAVLVWRLWSMARRDGDRPLVACWSLLGVVTVCCAVLAVAMLEGRTLPPAASLFARVGVSWGSVLFLFVLAGVATRRVLASRRDSLAVSLLFALLALESLAGAGFVLSRVHALDTGRPIGELYGVEVSG